MIWYRRSWKTALSRLKPVVLTLARLLEMVDMLMSCALKPVLLTQSAGFMLLTPYGGGNQAASFCRFRPAMPLCSVVT